MMTVDVIIPVCAPGREFYKLIEMLSDQTVKPERVIITETLEAGEKSGLNDLPGAFDIIPVKRSDYDHAGTRMLAASKATADAILFMTQDAVPTDRYLIEKLLRAIEDGAGAAFARQVARDDAGLIERLTRQFNYGETSYVRSSEDFAKYGIKTIFCSDTCMMYDRKTFERLGGFGDTSVFAEDMTYAHKLLLEGGKLAYVADAAVIHSHDYDLKANFRRSRALGINQAEHPEIYKTVSSEKEGAKYVRFILKGLITNKKPHKIPYFLLSCMVRYAGVLIGRICGK